jgi:hypothetical protein
MSDIQHVLLPIVDRLSNTITIAEMELLDSYPDIFLKLLKYNMYLPILQPERKEWFHYRLHKCRPPYTDLIPDVIENSNTNTNEKLSSICLSTLVSNYPPQRAIVLFDPMARIKGHKPHPIFQNITGNCLIIPNQIEKWPTWDHEYFSWLFPPPPTD